MGHADSASQYINLPFMSRNILGLMARLFWSFSPFSSSVEKLPDAAGVCYKRHTPVGQSGLFCPCSPLSVGDVVKWVMWL